MNKKILLEIIWWSVTIVTLVLVMFPIWSEVGSDYLYNTSNIAAIIVFAIFTRLIFVLRHTFIAKSALIKAIIIVLCIPLFFYFLDKIYDFQTFIDENGVSALLPNYKSSYADLVKYIKTEYLFFTISALITVIIIPFRMILSIWRTHNRGGV